MDVSEAFLERVRADEAELVLYTFDEEDALRLGELLVKTARERKCPIAIEIRRPTGQVLFHAAMVGARKDNDEWIRRKINVTFRFDASSLAVGLNLALLGTTIEDKYFVSPTEYSPFGGSFPVRVHGVGTVAAAAVSGLPQEEDHALVVECLRKLKEEKAQKG